MATWAVARAAAERTVLREAGLRQAGSSVRARRLVSTCRQAGRCAQQHATLRAGRRGTPRRAGAPCHAPAPRHGLGGRCGAAPAPRRGTLRAQLGRFGWRRHTRSCASAAATWCRCRRRERRRAARDGRASRRPTAATAAASTAARRGARSVRAVWLWLSWPARASCSRHLRRRRRGWSCGCCRAPARRLTPAGCSRAISRGGSGSG